MMSHDDFAPRCPDHSRDVQTSGPLHSGSSSETCRPELTVVDAIGVGLSLQTLVKSQRMPAETREVYLRVGQQLEAAARLAIKGGGR